MIVVAVVMPMLVVMMIMVGMVVVIVVVVIVTMVMAVIVMIMTMTMTMRMSAMGMIGATRRLEGLFDVEHHRAQPLQHGADDMIAQDHDAILLDLRREMTVAEMPGKFDQMRAVAAAHLEQLFVCGKDFDQFTILAHQHVTIGKKHRLLEIEHHHLAVLQMQELAAQVPQIVRQLDL